MNQIELKDHLSVREFAKKVGTSKVTVWKYIKRGRIHAVNLGMTWIHRNQVDVYLKLRGKRL